MRQHLKAQSSDAHKLIGGTGVRGSEAWLSLQAGEDAARELVHLHSLPGPVVTEELSPSDRT